MNAKDEFLSHVRRINSSILCAHIECEVFDNASYEYYKKPYTLKLNFTGNDYDEFLSSLDFQYDSGYGGQVLFGIIYYTDNTWSERGEYDGAEWWEYKKLPEIPIQCRS